MIRLVDRLYGRLFRIKCKLEMRTGIMDIRQESGWYCENCEACGLDVRPDSYEHVKLIDN